MPPVTRATLPRPPLFAAMSTSPCCNELSAAPRRDRHLPMMRASIAAASLGKPQTALILRTMMEFCKTKGSSEAQVEAWSDRRAATPSTLALMAYACPCALAAQTAATPPADPEPRLQPVVVTATRTEVAPFNVPASIDRIGSE